MVEITVAPAALANCIAYVDRPLVSCIKIVSLALIILVYLAHSKSSLLHRLKLMLLES